MKQLSEMTNEELWKLFPVIICKYNPEWPNLYLTEKRFIENILSTARIFRMNHIGSTAIPGIYAKSTIDILLEMYEDVRGEYIIDKMKRAGYLYTYQKDNPAPHMMFLKGYTLEGFKGQSYHVHVRYPGDWDEFYYRDYLIINPHIAKEYAKLKLKLKKRFEFNRDGYTEAKSEFIEGITRRAKLEFGNKYKPKDKNKP